MSTVGIFYSNPTDTPRLRLDKERKSLDAALKRQGCELDKITYFYAASVDDVITALSENSFEIVQFSGHGAENGIHLESPTDDGGTVLTADQLVKIVAACCPSLRSLLLISCYSSELAPTLSACARYLITVTGDAEDGSCIDFVADFYGAYFRHESITVAFASAQFLTGIRNPELKAVLTRRSISERSGEHLVTVIPQGPRSESIWIDVSEAEADISRLNIPRADFILILSRKMRIHRWLFDTPKEKAVLSVGPYFGTFSWTNADELVTCHRILRVKEGIDEVTCMIWSSLVVAYNDHFASKYRSAPRFAPGSALLYKHTYKEYEKTYKQFFEGSNAEHFRALAKDQFVMTKANFKANLEKALSKIEEEDYAYAVVYLETSLTYIHDFVDTIGGVVLV